MKKNMGSVDQIFRLAVALLLMALYYEEVFPKPLNIIALVVALLLTLTCLFCICPLYNLFGINTCKKAAK